MLRLSHIVSFERGLPAVCFAAVRNDGRQFRSCRVSRPIDTAPYHERERRAIRGRLVQSADLPRRELANTKRDFPALAGCRRQAARLSRVTNTLKIGRSGLIYHGLLR